MAESHSLTRGIELVSHDVRAEILLALAERMQESPRDQTLRFAELRDSVGHDDPGNFNYHLKRLQGNLVDKREDGYRLSDIGHHFVALLVSGSFDPEASREFPDVETSCPICTEPATVTYEDGMLRTSCDNGHSSMLNVGPELLDSYSVSETLNIAFRRTLWEVKSTMSGICPYCEGKTVATVSRFQEGPIPVLYEWTCNRCGVFTQNSPSGCILFQPAVVSFCYQHDIDIFQRAWDMMVQNVETGSVVSEDPLRVQVGISVDQNRLVLTLDESATVVDVSRTSEAPA